MTTPIATNPPGAVAAQVAALGLTQTLAWASSVYLPAIVAAPASAELQLPADAVFAAFSLALLAMAALGPAVGKAIDRRGGRPVLCLSNLVLAAGLVALGLSASGPALFLAWLLIGAGMALGLYDAAFAALVRHHGLRARGPITGITLVGGFASTLGWPLSAWLVAGFGWREACFAWAALHLVVALPLNLRFLPTVAASTVITATASPSQLAGNQRRSFMLLAVFGAATAFVTSAMAAHLPGLLQLGGLGAAAAITAAALFGPAQVAARLFEFLVMHRLHLPPLWTARVATLLHPLGAVALLAGGVTAPLAALFALCHGAGNGLITIAKGTLPLALFGPAAYGGRQGWLAVGQRLAQAAAPFAYASVLSRAGTTAALGLSAGLSLLALLALLAIRDEEPRARIPG